MKAEGIRSGGLARRHARLASVALMLFFASAATALVGPLDGGRRPAMAENGFERIEIVLEPAALPAADRERFDDRLTAIAESIAANVPLFRSFDPREVLSESLHRLAVLGVDVGEKSDAILNFDTIEASMPADARATVEALPWVRQVRRPIVATSSGDLDSEGLATIGSEIANLGGITGEGFLPNGVPFAITVAIIDDGFAHLNATVSDPSDELKPIPVGNQFLVRRAGDAASSQSLNGVATQALEGEHGTACAEVVYEVAPGVDFLLFGFEPQIAPQYVGGVTSAQIQFAIREAAELGADVILIPMYVMATMSNPLGTGSPGNAFTDDVDFATSLGAVVVVSAGNEDLRTVEETFTPCLGCTGNGICETAGVNDTSFHAWDPTDQSDFGIQPLNDLIFPDEVLEGFEESEHFTCYTATDAANPSDFKVRLYRSYDPNGVCDPICPSDDCMTAAAPERSLNEGFSVKDLPMYGADGFTRTFYYLTVRRVPGATETPKIRIACTGSVRELFWSTETGKSLSDLAVLTNAISVGAVDDLGELICDVDESSGHCSSRGPTSLVGGPVKPDLVGPGNVTNFAVWDYETSFNGNFIGSSAAAAHVAGLAALIQSQALQRSGALLSPQTVREALIRAADPMAVFAGEEFQFGAGMAHIPDPAPGPYAFTPIAPCRVVDTRSGSPLQAGVERAFSFSGTCGIPNTTKAVSGILTVVSPSQLSFVNLYPADNLPTGTSSINFPAGRNIANNVMVKLSENTSSVRAVLNAGTAHFLFDVTGYFQ